jgi:hypothetical protein
MDRTGAVGGRMIEIIFSVVETFAARFAGVR